LHPESESRGRELWRCEIELMHAMMSSHLANQFLDLTVDS
jgi:hypothetical protein